MAELATNRPVSFAGHLGADPKPGQTKDGTPVANFDVAYTPRVRQGEEWVNGETVWYSVAAFRGLGENVLESLHNWDHVMVLGKHTDVEFDRRDGSTGVDHQVTADFVGPALNFATAEIHPVERSIARSADSGVSVAG